MIIEKGTNPTDIHRSDSCRSGARVGFSRDATGDVAIAAPAPVANDSSVNESWEIASHLLLEGIRLKYGYDFRDYAQASMRRRIQALCRHFRMQDPLQAIQRILHDPSFFQNALPWLTVGTTEMFRDPAFFRLLRNKVLPVLKTYPTINLWCAGCSKGEEVYSLAILLEEEGLGDRATIFATDINPQALKAAKEGIYPAEALKAHTRNYIESGGQESFSRYYTASYGLAKMDSSLTRHVVFSEHNLATDHVFSECHLILCRNVMIYFNRSLQDRALALFAESLCYGGFLGLGSKETLRFSVASSIFDTVDSEWKVYRKNTLSERYCYGQ